MALLECSREVGVADFGWKTLPNSRRPVLVHTVTGARLIAQLSLEVGVVGPDTSAFFGTITIHTVVNIMIG